MMVLCFQKINGNNREQGFVLLAHAIRKSNIRCCFRICTQKSVGVPVGLEVSPNTYGLTRKCPRITQAFTIVF